VKLEWHGKYTSSELSGLYDSVCPYGGAFQSCGMMSQSGGCGKQDRTLNFQGEVGKLTRVPSTPSGPYSVTFNDGRTSYGFFRHEFEVLRPDSNYELWWVQRRGKERTVRKKKSFRVIHPKCTFDTVNNQYFPFAQLDENGSPVDAFKGYHSDAPAKY